MLTPAFSCLDRTLSTRAGEVAACLRRSNDVNINKLGINDLFICSLFKGDISRLYYTPLNDRMIITNKL